MWDKLFDNDADQQPSFEDYINVDREVHVTGTLTDEDILLSYVEHEEQDETNDEKCDDAIKKVTKNDAQKALVMLHKYLEMAGRCNKTAFYKIYDLETIIDYSNEYTQKKLTNYFNKV